MTNFHSTGVQRRLLLKMLGVLPGAIVVRTSSALAAGKPQHVRIVEFDASGTRTGVIDVEKIEKPLGEWKKQLTPEQFFGYAPGRYRAAGIGQIRFQPCGRPV